MTIVPKEGREVQCVFPCDDSPVEAVPGLWGDHDKRGMVCVVGVDEFDTLLETGAKLAEVYPAAVQTRVCQTCG